MADEIKNHLDSRIMVESISDWILLFDSQTYPTMDAWIKFNQKLYQENGEIIDGLLTVSKQGDAVDKNTGFAQSIVSKELFDNFELEAHYRMSPGANSGIMYQAQFRRANYKGL